MSLEDDIAKSRHNEMQTYLTSMRAMYENALDQNGETYDIAYNLTSGFRQITAEAIVEDSRIIKILRYTMAPSISQMKFGQMFGLDTVEQFERDRLTSGTVHFATLRAVAGAIADFATTNLDRRRFLWLTESVISDLPLAHQYARSWTCSVAADQNAQTAYRNWRKEQQERAVIGQLIEMGYVRSTFSGLVESSGDVNLGEYTQEIKVKGRTVQKADVAFRSRQTRGLVLIEAKAVGVTLDATKRVKECCDKANDWSQNARLGTPQVVAVIGGFFTETNIRNLEASGVCVVWEHDLAKLAEVA